MTVRAGRGVDPRRNDRCSAIAHAWAATTWPDPSEQRCSRGAFAHVVPTSGRSVAVTSDGIGSKVEIAERMGRYDTLGFDLVAMVVDDLAAAGARPTALTNILDVDRLDEPTIEALMRGLAAAARAAGVVIAGGEIAQLGPRVRGYGDGMHFNWCATGLGDPFGRPTTPERSPRPGDVLIALSSDGFRSNGFTLARSILEERFGSSWHEAVAASGRAWGEVLLAPSRIYAPTVVAMAGSAVPLLACVHVTGGGLPGNVPRILEGLGLRAELRSLPPPHPEMIELIEVAGLEPQEAYLQWNMGTGFVCVVPPEAAHEAIGIAEDRGIRCEAAGELTEGAGLSIDGRAWGLGELRYEEAS